jgi:hypothetical protein
VRDLEVELAKKVFPKMPREVFDEWIAPSIEKYGWNFTSADESTAGSEWERSYGRENMLFFATADWNLSEQLIERRLFFFDTRQRADWIIRHATEGVKTKTANVHNTVQRFRACTSIVHQSGTIPKPLIGYWFGCQIELVDGNHRLAALIHAFGFNGNVRVPIWLAQRPN